ncbi:MAG: hypothetical protein GTO45_08515 [Candidatus Aminicenantes bacterium]|nr:hypothetical protein [Candidatus Aminicenantes bacterium]NIN84785.1 hypothetical protein [Candidatus Aminicenantes bacterium]
MFDDFYFNLTPDAEKNLDKIMKKLTREGGDLFKEINGDIREESLESKVSWWREALREGFAGQLQSSQILDFDCRSSEGPVFVSVHISDTRDITYVEFGAAWKPGAAVPSLYWQEKSFVSEVEDSPLLETMNHDARLRKTVKRLLRSKYLMTNKTITCPDPVLQLGMEDRQVVLYARTTMRTENIPLLGIVLSFKFGVSDFIEILGWMKKNI